MPQPMPKSPLNLNVLLLPLPILDDLPPLALFLFLLGPGCGLHALVEIGELRVE